MGKSVFVIIILFCILSLTTQSAYAAFPIKSKSEKTNTSFKTAEIPAGKNILQVLTPDETIQTRREPQGWGIASLSCAVAGLVTFPGGLLLGIPAIVFGAIGMGKNKRLRGLAIAGFTLGLMEIATAIVLLVVFVTIFGLL